MFSKLIFLTLITQVSSVMTGMLTSIVTAHVLGPIGRGDYFFVTTLAMLIVQVSQLGLASSNTYLVAQDIKMLSKLLINSTWISVVVGLVSVIITFIILTIIRAPYIVGEWILIISVPVSMLYLLVGNLFVGIHKIKIFNVIQLFGGWLTCLTIIITCCFKENVEYFLYASTIALSVIVCAMYRILLNYVDKKKWSWKFNILSFTKGVHYGIKAYIVTFIGLLILKGNIFILKYYVSSEVVGFYSVSAQLTDCLNILPISIGLVIFPRFISEPHSRWHETKRMLFMTALLMTIVCFFAGALVYPFVKYFFGEKFLAAVPIFLWMLPGTFFLSLVTILSQYLASIGFPRQLIWIWLIDLVISWVIGSYFVPIYQGIGSGMTFSLTYFILFVEMGLFSYIVERNEVGSSQLRNQPSF